jgi:hypothetical protein
MACQLNKEDALALYQDIYEDIKQRIDGVEPKVFNVSTYIKKLYADLMDPEDPTNALQVVQAVPQLLDSLIANNRDVKSYFLKNGIKRDDIDKLFFDFEDIKNVAKYVKTPTRSVASIKAEIKTANNNSKNIEVKNPSEKTIAKSATQANSAIISDALTTQPQFAIPKDPSKVSPEERDLEDPQKRMFYDVIKQIISLTESMPDDTEEVEYQGKKLAIRAVNLLDFPEAYLADSEKEFKGLNPSSDLILAAITDTSGDYIYFTEEGDITNDPSKGRIVYQYIRKVRLEKGVLTLMNRSNYAYSLLPAQTIVEQENAAIEKEDGIGMSNSEFNERLKQVKATQKEQLNKLYQLNNAVNENRNEVYLLPITGGSFGIVKTTFVPLAQTDIEVDELSKPIIGGTRSGYIQIGVNKKGNTGIIRSEVYLQRGNIDEALASKIAKVLTSTATLPNGEQLTVNQRANYFQNVLGNLKRNKITADAVDVDGVLELQVKIDGVVITQEELYTPESEAKIFNHLMNAVQASNGETYSANIHYDAELIGKDFVDYDITEDKVKRFETSYFDFVKPYILIEYSNQSGQYFRGKNAYLNIAIPSEILPVTQDNYDFASIATDKKKAQRTATKTRTATTKQPIADIEPGEVVFEVKKQYSRNVAITNMEVTDATVNIAADFTKGDAAAVRDKNSPKYFYLALTGKKNKALKLTDAAISNLAKQLNKTNPETLNFVGNNVVELIQSTGKYNQAEIDKFVSNILEKLIPELEVTPLEIVTNGESGVSEAVIKAAMKMGLPVRVAAPKGYAFTQWYSKSKTKSFTVVNKKRFMERFEEQKEEIDPDKVKLPKKRKAKSKTKEETKKVTAKVTSKSTTTKPTAQKTKKEAAKPTLTAEQEKSIKDKLTALMKSFNNALQKKSTLFQEKDEEGKPLERAKGVGTFFDRLFTTESDKKKAREWWDKNPLSKHIPLEVITEIVNSNAFATWSKHGITLYQADGGTSVDLYHEAWHGFSQLFLTHDEKISLYDEMRKIPKWENAEDIDIEEAIAEDFRSYMKFKTKFPGIIGKIFTKIGNFLRIMFGKITRQDMTRPRDIASIKDLYDNLYKGDILDFEYSMDNVFPEWHSLNRLKVPQAVTKEAKNFEEFTVKEAQQIVITLDNLIGSAIERYNTELNTKAGPVKIFADPQNRVKLYHQVLADLEAEEERYIAMKTYHLENMSDSEEDLFIEQQLSQQLEMLTKMIKNFGDIENSLNGKEKVKGLVAFHIKNSRFNVLKQAYLEEDTTDLDQSYTFNDDRNNKFSAKDLAAEDTMMLLGSVFKLQRDAKGNVIRDEDGFAVRETDYFGFDQLEDIDITWNRVAKVLAGSLDPQEIVTRLRKNQNNYPEFEQIINMLPDPFKFGEEAYKNKAEEKLETNFWQDLKKPRVPYVQLTISKTITQKEQKDERGKKIAPEKAEYQAGVSKSNFSTISVLKDWETNFATSTPVTNPFVTYDEFDNPILDTQAIIDTFSDRSGFVNRRSLEFLRALGINLDIYSPEIKAITDDYVKFSSAYQLNLMLDTIKIVHKASKTTDVRKIAKAEEFKRNPLKYLQEGLPKELRTFEQKKGDVQSKLKALAVLQNTFSDGYSSFSVMTPEGNRVWEQFLDNTITRITTSINLAETWQELTNDKADPDGRFKHMRWLSQANNTFSQFSVLLNSVFYLDELSPNYGQKRKVLNPENNKLEPAKIILNNVGGTQLVTVDSTDVVGVSTASADGTTKFLQEINTMLLSGVEEFMRHASKNTAMGIRTDDLKTYESKKSKHLYIDIAAFKPNTLGEGESHGFDVISGYIAAEANRIFRYKQNKETPNLPIDDRMSDWTSYNRKVRRKDGTVVDAAEAFTVFDDMLSKSTQLKIYNVIDKALSDGRVSFNLQDVFNENQTLRDEAKRDITNYFEKQTQANLKRLESARYIDVTLQGQAMQPGMSQKQIDTVISKAYSYNSFIHKFETIALAYGDMLQYNHDKEEFHKRNAGLTSGGRGMRSDAKMISYVNSNSFRKYYAETIPGVTPRQYDGTFATAILKEDVIDESKYYDEYLEELTKVYTNRIGNKDKALEMAKTALKEYKGMKHADGQGYISFESYRLFKTLEGKWSDAQELLYRKVAAGEKIEVDEVIEYFPPYKVQHFGPIKTKGLPLTSFHKFSLFPLVPSTIAGSNLQKLHNKMMEQQIDYVVYESGSKVGHIGSGDVVVNSDGSFNNDVVFTKNIVFAEYIKNQTEINPSYKNKSVFSTQMRKLILEGLYEKGVIQTTNEDKITNPRVQRYLNNVSEYTELLKLKLLNEIGFEQRGDEYVAVDKESTEKLANLIRENLEREDVYGDHLIDLIDVTEDGSLRYDLSIHPEAQKIERLLLSIINKRLIKQKVKGEPLVQVSVSMFNNLFTPVQKPELKSEEWAKKYTGSTVLPTYHKGKDGLTTAAKVMISLQGDYANLLNLEDSENPGQTISTIDRLNELIKNPEWVEKNKYLITTVGVRIPVQGLNSMEYFEVYHFLPPESGNVIVVPSEIVAKSGGDFDIDKLTLYMPNINGDGTYAERLYTNEDGSALDKLKEEIAERKANDEEIDDLFDLQAAALQNELIEDIRNILELPQNYSSLVTPNGTFLLKDIADDLSQYVMQYDPYQNMMSSEYNMSAPDKNGKSKKVISPTRVLEALYNVYKHESNIYGKRTLGLGAVENTFNVLFNSIPGGVYMPNTFYHSNETQPRQSLLWLKHNKMNVNGEDVISLSNRFDVNGTVKIADVFSQLINGWVDVEKDPWIFFIQGNYEVAPILLYLIKAGTPIEDAIYFVSNPLVRQYVDEQRMAKSTFADVLNRKPDSRNFVKYEAATQVIGKYFPPEQLKMFSKNLDRYYTGLELATNYLESKGQTEFTKEEMYDLIKDYKQKDELTPEQEELAKAMFLHFLQIEQQTTGITRLKMASNPDTNTKSSGTEVEMSQAAIEELKYESKIMPGLVEAMKNDSVIGSFFNNPLALALNNTLFKLRFNKAISDYLIGRRQVIQGDSEKMFGPGNLEIFTNMFRNDILSYLFQNAVRKYELSNSYKSYDLQTSVPVKLVSQLNKFSSYVKTEADGTKTLYIDEKNIKKDFKNESWAKGSEAVNSYEKLGLYPLALATFKTNYQTNEGEYIKFVAEREYLRSIYVFNDYAESENFDEEQVLVKAEFPDLSKEKLARMTYEKFLANRALENTLNPYHMFKDPKNAFAIQMANILKNKELAKDYLVLAKTKVETSKENKMSNIYIAEKDYTTDLSNLYYQNLQDLANPAIKKVADTFENDKISDMFARLPLYAYMQTGINKSKYNFTNVVDYKQFVDILNDEIVSFTESLKDNTDANAFLDHYYKMFIKQNSKSNVTRNKFKNYLTDYKIGEKQEVVSGTNPQFELKETNRENIYLYDDRQKANVALYKGMAETNPDAIFVYGTTVAHLQNKDKKDLITGQTALFTEAKDMSVGLPVAADFIQDYLSSIPASAYQKIKDNWEIKIANLKSLVKDGVKVAFSEKGYGNSRVMPQELFVYLSKRLYEEFGYLNPDSVQFQEIYETITNLQGISDEEILKQREAEEDPFKCEI